MIQLITKKVSRQALTPVAAETSLTRSDSRTFSRLLEIARSVSASTEDSSTLIAQLTSQALFSGLSGSTNGLPPSTARKMSKRVIDAGCLASWTPPDFPTCVSTRPAFPSWISSRRMTTGFVRTLAASRVELSDSPWRYASAVRTWTATGNRLLPDIKVANIVTVWHRVKWSHGDAKADLHLLEGVDAVGDGLPLEEDDRSVGGRAPFEPPFAHPKVGHSRSRFPRARGAGIETRGRRRFEPPLDRSRTCDALAGAVLHELGLEEIHEMRRDRRRRLSPAAARDRHQDDGRRHSSAPGDGRVLAHHASSEEIRREYGSAGRGVKARPTRGHRNRSKVICS